jgi:hypothetical protein
VSPEGSYADFNPTKEAWIPAALGGESALDCCRTGLIPI